LRQYVRKGFANGLGTPLTPQEWDEMRARPVERAGNRNGQ